MKILSIRIQTLALLLPSGTAMALAETIGVGDGQAFACASLSDAVRDVCAAR